MNEKREIKSLDLARYQRQMLLPKIGVEGQQKLSAARVLLVGCGALGTVLAESLVRAGVGHLRIVDRDFIELNNLQRQVLFDEADIAAGWPKAIAAQRKLQQINSSVPVDAVVADVNFTNIEKLAEAQGAGGGVDLILDGTDNFETRFLINDVAVKYGIPWIYGACIASHGLGMVIRPGAKGNSSVEPVIGGGCLRCLFETIPPPGGGGPTCDTAGILGPTVQMVASWQANEALKILTGNLESISPYLFSFDSWENRFQQINISKIRELADCPVCKHGQYDYLTGKNGSSTTTLCGRNAVQITPPIPPSPPHENGSVGTGSIKSRMDFARIAETLRNSGTVTYNAFMLKCVLTSAATPHGSTAEAVPPMELTLFTDGRAIIKGTHDPGVARTIYARYIGS